MTLSILNLSWLNFSFLYALDMNVFCVQLFFLYICIVKVLEVFVLYDLRYEDLNSFETNALGIEKS